MVNINVRWISGIRPGAISAPIQIWRYAFFQIRGRDQAVRTLNLRLYNVYRTDTEPLIRKLLFDGPHLIFMYQLVTFSVSCNSGPRAVRINKHNGPFTVYTVMNNVGKKSWQISHKKIVILNMTWLYHFFFNKDLTISLFFK